MGDDPEEEEEEMGLMSSLEAGEEVDDEESQG